MKPDWNDAPEWANYRTVDDDGAVTWYELKPTAHKNGYWLYKGSAPGKAQVAYIKDWISSLTKRPGK